MCSFSFNRLFRHSKPRGEPIVTVSQAVMSNSDDHFPSKDLRSGEQQVTIPSVGGLHPADISASEFDSFLSGVFEDSSGITEEQKSQARTERKRSREKQRRLDVNKQFNELTAALRRIEGEMEPCEELRSASLLPTTNNRADLMARAILVLDVLHEKNKRRKLEVEQLSKDLATAKQAGEETAAKLKERMMAPQNMGGGKVMMMVPMMMASGDGSAAATPMPFAGGLVPPDLSDLPAWGMPWMMAPPNTVVPPPPPPAEDQEKKQAAVPSGNIEGGNLAHCA